MRDFVFFAKVTQLITGSASKKIKGNTTEGIHSGSNYFRQFEKVFKMSSGYKTVFEIFLVAFAPKVKLQPTVSGDRSFFYPGLLMT